MGFTSALFKFTWVAAHLAQAVPASYFSTQQPLDSRWRPQTIDHAEDENWSAQEVGDEVCRAGSHHFAGRINVTDTKSMFFCKISSSTFNSLEVI